MSNRPARLLGLTLLATALPACGLLLGLDDYSSYCKPHGVGEPPDCEPYPGAGGSGAGGSLACEPGTTTDCYDGPAGTEGVGVCAAGKRTCSAEGVSDGVCEGEVKPDIESCAAPDDESCDGLDCVLWTEKLSQEGNIIAAIQFDPSDGTFVLVGNLSTALNLPGQTLIPTADIDGFVARIRPDGTAVWARRIEGGDDQFTESIDVDAQGNIFLGGSSQSPFTLDSFSVPAGKFVAKLSAKGEALWAKGLAGAHSLDNLPNVSATQEGDVIVSGGFSGGLDLGDGLLNGSGIYIAKLRGSDGFGSKSGAEGFWSHSASEQISGPLMNRIDDAGNVYFAGYTTEAITFAGESLPNAGGSDWIFGKLTSNGALAWARNFGGGSNDVLRSIEVDKEGNLLLLGFFNFVFDFPSFHFDPADGNTLLFKWNTDDSMAWGKQYDDKSSRTGLAIDAQSNIAVFGAFVGTLELGSGPQTPGPDANAALFLAKLSPAGDPAWVRTYPVNIQFSNPEQAVAFTPEGTELTAVAVPSTVDFGAGPLMIGESPFEKQLVLAGFGR